MFLDEPSWIKHSDSIFNLKWNYSKQTNKKWMKSIRISMKLPLRRGRVRWNTPTRQRLKLKKKHSIRIDSCEFSRVGFDLFREWMPAFIIGVHVSPVASQTSSASSWKRLKWASSFRIHRTLLHSVAFTFFFLPLYFIFFLFWDSVLSPKHNRNIQWAKSKSQSHFLLFFCSKLQQNAALKRYQIAP